MIISWYSYLLCLRGFCLTFFGGHFIALSFPDAAWYRMLTATWCFLKTNKNNCTLTANSKLDFSFFFPCEGLSQINSNVSGVTRTVILQQSTVIIMIDICCHKNRNRLFYNTEDVKSFLLLQPDFDQQIWKAAWIGTMYN